MHGHGEQNTIDARGASNVAFIRCMKIVILDSTALPGVKNGPRSPAYFSRFVIDHLRQLGHDIIIADGFDPALCASADLVWTEWVNEEAYRAAASGVCRRLVLRMRGFDAHGPLDQLTWENVDALVYESNFLQQLAEERFPGLRGFRSSVIPSGIDVAQIKFKEREAGPVVALVARGIADKGYQLAVEWVRQRPAVQLHLALAQPEPRLLRYLQYVKSPNVTLHGQVDTTKWLDEIGANFLLSASNWESLGYTIAEAMALGIKPLIHDTPGASVNWLSPCTPRLWRSFGSLDQLVFHDAARNIWDTVDGYNSHAYRHFVEYRLAAAKQSALFDALVNSLPARSTLATEALRRHSYDHTNKVFRAMQEAITRPVDMGVVEELALDFRGRTKPHGLMNDERHGVALMTAAAFYNHSDLERAEVWACRALAEHARPEAFALLGEIAAARGDVEEALQWYRAACAAATFPTRYRLGRLSDRHWQQRRLHELEQQQTVELPVAPQPSKFVFIVATRNAEKWIARCLESIKEQTVDNFRCIIIDDVSTDKTAEIAETFLTDTRFVLVRNDERKWQARNTVEWARTLADPEDVVVLVDGDDRLADAHVLERLVDYYKRGAWMTYGGSVHSDGTPGTFGAYPQRISRAGAFHEWRWCGTHLRTFKRFLLDQLADADFLVEGEWPKMAGDVAFMLPMLQMSCERAVYVNAPLYIYTVDNPDSEHHTDAPEQMRIRDLLYARPPKA